MVLGFYPGHIKNIVNLPYIYPVLVTFEWLLMQAFIVQLMAKITVIICFEESLGGQLNCYEIFLLYHDSRHVKIATITLKN